MWTINIQPVGDELHVRCCRWERTGRYPVVLDEFVAVYETAVTELGAIVGTLGRVVQRLDALRYSDAPADW